LDHVLKPAEDTQAPKITDIVLLHANNSGRIQPNDSEVE
jgi:hypothetical protein